MTAPRDMTAGRPRRETLTRRVGEALRARILDGRLRPGARLPTEQALIDAYGVSRTVIREAVAGLRADGLVEARHGVGVFVREPAAPRSPPLATAQRFSSIIEMLELRAAIEIEAAGIAAERGSPAQKARVREAFDAFSGAIATGAGAEDADFGFHLRIMEATNNPLFAEFIGSLGRSTIPRAQLPGFSGFPAGYPDRLRAEHRRIMVAVAGGDAGEARAAMRAHLEGAVARYRSLMEAGDADSHHMTSPSGAG